MIVGIDNGVTGGLVALSPIPGVAPVAMLPMPCRKTGSGREVDILPLVQWLLTLEHGEDGAVFAIEECPQHSRQKSVMRSMAFSYGKIVGAIEARFPRVPLIRVKSGNDLSGWQRRMLGTVPKGETKAYALEVARRLWPSETWLATPRSSVPDTGLVDAALIAEFVRSGGHKRPLEGAKRRK